MKKFPALSANKCNNKLIINRNFNLDKIFIGETPSILKI